MRLPAYGREIALLLRAGRRPIGGTIVVTTRWEYARAFARVVTPPEIPPEEFDLSFLRAQEIIVVVPEEHEELGHRLLASVLRAMPKRAVLLVKRDGQRASTPRALR